MAQRRLEKEEAKARDRLRLPPDPAPQRAPVDAQIGADFMGVFESNGRIGVAVRYG